MGPDRGEAEGIALTPRELEIARLVAGCLSPKKVALRLGISVHTVRVHIKAIATKLPGDGRPIPRIIHHFKDAA